MNTRTEMRIKPDTVQRLESLRRGQEMVYYRGRIEADINECAPRSRGGVGAPTYAALLREVQVTALELSKVGKLLLSERTVTRDGFARPFSYTEYVAVGTGK